MINLIAWLGAGLAIGWLANVGAAGKGKRSLARDIFAGLAGAWIGGQFFVSMIRDAHVDLHVFTITPLVMAVAGAVILLIIMRMLRRPPKQ